MPELKRRELLLGGLSMGSLVILRPGRAAASPGAAAKILIVGDSMIAGGFGLYLEKRLEKGAGFSVYRQGKSSSGLARPDFFNWFTEAEKLVERERPDAVVVMFGGNDGQGLYMGREASSKWIRYGEENWTREYRRRVNVFADAIAPQGQQIFWVGMPAMRPEKLNRRVKHINMIFRAEMAVRRQALFIDIWPSLAGSDGRYRDKLDIGGETRRIRAWDGIHLSGAGARLVVELVAPIVVEELGRAPMGGDDDGL